MQYVNDDMDDLFRRAAENYPLDTRTSDWSKVAGALVTPTNQVVTEKKNRSYRWLVMLIPLSMICHLVISPARILYHGNGSALYVSESGQNKTTVTASPSPDETALATHSFNEIVILGSPVERSKSAIAPLVARKKQASRIHNKPDFSLPQQSKGSVVTEAFSKSNLTSLPLQQKDQWTLKPLDPSLANIVSATQNTSRLKQKRFYGGIMGGIDASTVKFQKVENAGYEAGLLLGYELNKKWSIESGFFLDRKFYYTKAEYFNKSEIGYMPPNSWITELEGNCSMFEIPLSIKFNISSNKKSSWFSTAGVSSYIMKKEDYSYVYYYATPGTYATHDKTYKHSSTDLFSVMTFSAGYTHRIGKTLDLRLEPYIKLPITGMGFGSLPLSSGGIRAGITRKLF